MDNNPVHFLSSCFSPRDTSFVLKKNKQGQRGPVSCPRVVEEYNNIMGGVDRFDQLRQYYEIRRRSTKWWHRILYYCLDMAIINAHILMKTDKKTSEDQLQFRLNLARQDFHQEREEIDQLLFLLIRELFQMKLLETIIQIKKNIGDAGSAVHLRKRQERKLSVLGVKYHSACIPVSKHSMKNNFIMFFNKY